MDMESLLRGAIADVTYAHQHEFDERARTLVKMLLASAKGVLQTFLKQFGNYAGEGKLPDLALDLKEALERDFSGD